MRGAAVKVPRDLSLLDSSTLSLCLSESGPIKLAVRCGCRGSCVRNCNCRTAGEECSRWCSCQPSKCKSKLQQKYAEGEFCVRLSLKIDLSFSGAAAAALSELGLGERPVTPVTTPSSSMASTSTPCNPPPPLHASTAIVTESQLKRNKKKLFTEKLGPQEI